MRTESAGVSVCVLALSLGATITAAGAAETEGAAPKAVGPEAAVTRSDTSSDAAPQPAAAVPKLTTSQKLFGTFSRYKGHGDGATYTYQLVEKDGEKLYCQQEVITSTRFSKKGVCLTLAQMEAREASRRRNAEQFLRQGEDSRTNPPAADSFGGRYNNAVGGTNMPK